VQRFPDLFSADQVLEPFERRLTRMHWLGDSWPRWWPNFGPGILAGCLSARVVPSPATVWFEPVTPTTLQALQWKYAADNRWLERIKQLFQRTQLSTTSTTT
jgi:hypothetical protein